MSISASLPFMGNEILNSWNIMRIILIRYHNNSMNVSCLLARNKQKQKPSQKQKTDYWAGTLEQKWITKRVVIDMTVGLVMTKQKTPHQNKQHHPVLLESVLQVLSPKAGQSYLDLTAGYGGHAAAILDAIGESGYATLIERDANANTELKKRFGDNEKVEYINTDFVTAASELSAEGKQYDMVLADIGVSSPHLDMPQRGFSYSRAGPLDMRMDQRQATTAADLINSLSEDDLVNILRKYGEEPRARKVARAIIDERPVDRTDLLATIVENAVGKRYAGGTLPRVFQALRIAVNDELGQLSTVLPLLPGLLKPGGRLAVISFHSLEDRLVKQFIKQLSYGLEAELVNLTKKPIKGTALDSHPRARSAMLRAAVK